MSGPHRLQEIPLRAIIFDFNGVVADDEMPHLQCFQQALAEHDLLLSREDYYGTYLGMDERTCTTDLLRKRDGCCDPLLHSKIIERKATLFRDYTTVHPAPLFPWAIEFVQQAAEHHRLAIASGGRRDQILSALSGSAIEKAFELVVSADECSVGKPDPAIYELTLRHLNARHPKPPLLRADECLVIEDSRAGVVAGLTAGMRVLAVATTYPASQLGDAHLILPSLKGITPADVAHRLLQNRQGVAGRHGR